MAQKKQASRKKASAKKSSVKKGVSSTKRSAPKQAQAATPEERHCLIAAMAYLIAEQRDFQGDTALDDWLQAEADVDAGMPTVPDP